MLYKNRVMTFYFAMTSDALVHTPADWLNVFGLIIEIIGFGLITEQLWWQFIRRVLPGEPGIVGERQSKSLDDYVKLEKFESKAVWIIIFGLFLQVLAIVVFH